MTTVNTRQRPLCHNRRRARREPPRVVAAIAGDDRHAPCPPTRCAGCRGLVLEWPCRLCEVRALKYGPAPREA